MVISYLNVKRKDEDYGAFFYQTFSFKNLKWKSLKTFRILLEVLNEMHVPRLYL